MKRTLAFVLAGVLFLSSAWIWINQNTVESWLVQQLVVDQPNEQRPLTGLQDEERWLVVVVDFDAHPATEGWNVEQANLLLEQAAVPYIEQLSGHQTELIVDVHPAVVRATETLATYGTDTSDRDTDENGVFLPLRLAEEVVSAVRSDVNWSQYDLDDDGAVDRFLILHTTKGQEENPTTKQRIWSHFTHFEEPLELPDSLEIAHYTMASLQTGSSGVGTMLHEMMHQMGAVDLYPVHDEHSFQSWKGPGDWDIMASGSWNGGGRWPGMPTGASLEMIGGDRIQTLDLDWPVTAQRPCIGPTIEMRGLTENGTVLKIDVAPSESIFVEHRNDAGYDQHLPGHGILVTYQDRSVGDLQQNELNTNPNLPWLKVIEADGRQDLLNAGNEGEASDVFGHNQSFGASGVQIRTHDGVLVPWTATVSQEGNTTEVSFAAEDCTPSFEVDLPNHGATLLANDSLPILISGEQAPCSANLVASDGRGLSLIEGQEGYELVFAQPGTPNSLLTITGSVSCDEGSVDLDYDVRVMNRIPVLDRFTDTIDPYQSVILDIPLESVGDGAQRLNVLIDGPLSRVASTAPSVDLASGMLSLTIEPNGLLTENMLVHGEIDLMTDEGVSWTLDVTLTAASSDESWQSTLLEPGRVLAILVGFLGAYLLLGTTAVPRSRDPQDDAQATVLPELDAWGRPVDDDGPWGDTHDG